MSTALMATVAETERYSKYFTIDNNGCWIWDKYINEKGYGYISHIKLQRAHRWFYELINGEIPNNLEIDHLCKVRNCVNPQHLEAVTRLTNVLRSEVVKEKCKRGHSFSPVNRSDGTKRLCQVCKRAGTIAGRKGISVDEAIEQMKKNKHHLLKENASLPTKLPSLPPNGRWVGKDKAVIVRETDYHSLARGNNYPWGEDVDYDPRFDDEGPKIWGED